MTASFKRWVILIIILFTGLMPVLDQPATAQDEADVFTIWVAPDVPEYFLSLIQPLLDAEEYRWVNNADEAQIVIAISDDTPAITSQWVYVPVVPFASLSESIRYVDIQSFWEGKADALNYLAAEPTLLLTADVYEAMVALMGTPADGILVEVVPADALVSLLWEQRPNAWSIVAFETLVPELKVLTLDEVNIFGDAFDVSAYPLKLQIGVSGDEQAVGYLADDLLETDLWQASNRDGSRMTRLVLTGVTAMSRATAYKMETLGLTHPAEGIMPFVGDADILHTSNEVPFSENCPPADPFLSTTIFCASDSYMELLTHIGLDVVELTGNHINDYGPGALRHSLELYEREGIATFGGGYTLEDARDAYITDHNGNTIAFIGCNVPGPFKAWVSEERAGAAPCDEAFLTEELPRLAAEVDILIMTVQQWEFYRYSVGLEQLNQFTNFANLGADIVIGSQAHQPQGFSFIPREGQPSAFLHHGLGNLFFDQMENIGTRQMFIDKVIIYDGRVISVVLFTGLIEDYCCPRPMTPDERRDFMTIIFAASDW